MDGRLRLGGERGQTTTARLFVDANVDELPAAEVPVRDKHSALTTLKIIPGHLNGGCTGVHHGLILTTGQAIQHFNGQAMLAGFNMVTPSVISQIAQRNHWSQNIHCKCVMCTHSNTAGQDSVSVKVINVYKCLICI